MERGSQEDNYEEMKQMETRGGQGRRGTWRSLRLTSAIEMVVWGCEGRGKRR